MKTKILILLLLLVMVTTSFCGCSNKNQLNFGETEGAVCMPGKAGESRTYGGTYIIHTGNREVTITEVSLVNP